MKLWMVPESTIVLLFNQWLAYISMYISPLPTSSFDFPAFFWIVEKYFRAFIRELSMLSKNVLSAWIVSGLGLDFVTNVAWNA